MKISLSTSVSIILATILVTSIFFMTAATSSSVGEYNPWADLDEDGSVTVLDAIRLANAFGATGNPTKPVVIAGYNWSYALYDFVILPKEEGNISIVTAGYKQITLGFKASKYLQPPPYGNISIATGFLMGTSNYHVYLDRFNATPGWTGPELPTLHEFPVARTYDIRGQTLMVAFYNPNNDAYRLVIEYYMTT